MYYTSTRDSSVKISSAQAIAAGISEEGGLFVPTEIPTLSHADILSLSKLGYKERAVNILGRYLTDFSHEELVSCVEGAYGDGKFSSEKIAPLVDLGEGTSVLELWRGPTCAFKDMALQILPHLLTCSVKKISGGRTTVILVATSGDTGKAALDGFSNVPDTKILVFYPSEGVSPMQKLQMTTQEGDNVGVCAIKGNFDDAQNGVKAIFTDKTIAERLAEKNMYFSSANSINWGRLAPQIVYYVSAYCDLVAEKKIAVGDKINFVVPTGNFGNILAAYYAMRMGLPVNRLVCASNANNVLTDFLNTGVYDRNRHFFTTVSPSMDILISSNLERLLYMLADGDDERVRGWMKSLKDSGTYDVGAEMLTKIKSVFAAGFCDDKKTEETIRSTFENKKYLCDTHTAVAVGIHEAYRAETGDKTPAVIASTASPFKFCRAVLDAVTHGNIKSTDEFGMTAELQELTGVACPTQLSSLAGKKVRFGDCREKNEMEAAVFEMLGIR